MFISPNASSDSKQLLLVLEEHDFELLFRGSAPLLCHLSCYINSEWFVIFLQIFSKMFFRYFQKHST